MTVEKWDRGEVIYEASKASFITNRAKSKKGIHLHIFLSLILIGISLLIIPLRDFEITQLNLAMIIVSVVTLVLSCNRFRHFEYGALYRFRIYKQGFVPHYNPKNKFSFNNELFILFEDITKIEPTKFGRGCNIQTTNGIQVSVGKAMNNEEGYLKLCEVLADIFEEFEVPELKEDTSLLSKIEKYVEEHEREKMKKPQERGDLLYEMPESVWRKNRRKSLFNFLFGMIMAIGLLIVIIIIVYSNPNSIFDYEFIMLTLVTLSIFGIFFSEMRSFNRGTIIRMKVYDKGLVPPYNPHFLFSFSTECFLAYEIIRKINFSIFGHYCYITLEDGNEIVFSTDQDKDGYYQVCEQLSKQFPNCHIPTKDQLQLYDRTIKMVVDKEISFEKMEKLMENSGLPMIIKNEINKGADEENDKL